MNNITRITEPIKLIKYKKNKYYPNSELTSKFKHVSNLFPSKPILTPNLESIYETNNHYIEVTIDNRGFYASFRILTIVDKTGKRIPDLELGGFLSDEVIKDHLLRIINYENELN